MSLICLGRCLSNCVFSYERTQPKYCGSIKLKMTIISGEQCIRFLKILRYEKDLTLYNILMYFCNFLVGSIRFVFLLPFSGVARGATSLDHFSFLDSVSDHTALALCLNIGLLYEPATETPTEKHFDFRRANLFLLKSLITAVNWEMLLANTTIDTNIDTMLCTFYDMFWSICEKCVPTVTSSRRRKTSKYPQHIVKLGSKCKRLSKCKTTKPSGMLLWRTAQREYMLAIQRFVNNREYCIEFRHHVALRFEH